MCQLSVVTRTCRHACHWTSIKEVDTALPGNGFGVPDIYVVEVEKDEETDRLFLDSDGDYGEETCED